MEKFGRIYQAVFYIGYLEKIDLIEKPVITEEIVVNYPLSLDLSISRGIDSKINTGYFSLYGLKEDTRLRLHKDRYDMKKYIGLNLYAGYETSGTSLIFSGTVKECYSYRQSGSTIYKTDIDAWDGGLDIYKALTNMGFSSNTPPQTILQELINTMPTVQLGAISDNVDFVDRIRGSNFIGKSYDAIQQFSNNSAFIDLGYMYVINRETDAIQGDLETISLDTGLLGSPRRIDTSLSIEIVFEPALIVGQQINLISENLPQYDGSYKIIGINHEGKISGAECGTLTTVVDLFIGTKIFNMIRRTV